MGKSAFLPEREPVGGGRIGHLSKDRSLVSRRLASVWVGHLALIRRPKTAKGVVTPCSEEIDKSLGMTKGLAEPDRGNQTLGRLSERTLGGSSPPATCAAQVTKEVEENEPQTFWGQLH